MNTSSTEVPILTYHSVDDSGSPISVRLGTFDRQMRYLKGKGYSSLALSDAVRLVRRGEELPERSLIIAFDDGYRNNLSDAQPILDRYGFTAIVFVTTGHIGRGIDWQEENPSIPQLPVMTWEEVKELRKRGFEIGAHTHSHPRLTDLDPEEVRGELLRSKSELEEHLGEEVGLFSYPFGCHNRVVREITSEVFDAAIANRPGRLRGDSDLYAIDRINATSGLFKLLPIRLSAGSGFDFYLSIKRTLDRIKGGGGPNP